MRVKLALSVIFYLITLFAILPSFLTDFFIVGGAQGFFEFYQDGFLLLTASAFVFIPITWSLLGERNMVLSMIFQSSGAFAILACIPEIIPSVIWLECNAGMPTDLHRWFGVIATGFLTLNAGTYLSCLILKAFPLVKGFKQSELPLDRTA